MYIEINQDKILYVQILKSTRYKDGNRRQHAS